MGAVDVDLKPSLCMCVHTDSVCTHTCTCEAHMYTQTQTDKCTDTGIHTHTNTDKTQMQTDRHKGRQTDRKADRQKGRDRQTAKHSKNRKKRRCFPNDWKKIIVDRTNTVHVQRTTNEHTHCSQTANKHNKKQTDSAASQRSKERSAESNMLYTFSGEIPITGVPAETGTAVSVPQDHPGFAAVQPRHTVQH